MYRQGDVLIVECDEIPKAATEVKRDGGRVVLAYGEATGHAHAIHDQGVRMFREDGSGSGLSYLHAAVDVSIRHEEHATIPLKAGTYKVIRQREYDAGEARYVAD